MTAAKTYEVVSEDRVVASGLAKSVATAEAKRLNAEAEKQTPDAINQPTAEDLDANPALAVLVGAEPAEPKTYEIREAAEVEG
jgi:hypothetical protein